MPCWSSVRKLDYLSKKSWILFRGRAKSYWAFSIRIFLVTVTQSGYMLGSSTEAIASPSVKWDLNIAGEMWVHLCLTHQGLRA